MLKVNRQKPWSEKQHSNIFFYEIEKNLKEKLEIRDSSLSTQDSPMCLLRFAASSCLVQRRFTRKPKGVIAIPAKRVITAIPAKPHHSR